MPPGAICQFRIKSVLNPFPACTKKGTALNILHLALGGCLRKPPVHYGLTADTGGHIAYVLEVATHQAQHADVSGVTIVTRLFDDGKLGSVHAQPTEHISEKLTIHRIATSNRRYIEKEQFSAELPALIEAFCEYLSQQPERPDVIHAHFADAASIAREAERRFGIPFIYTPHALGIDKQAETGACDSLVTRIEAERAAIISAAAIIVSTGDEAERQIGRYGVATGDRVRIIAPGAPAHFAGAGPTVVDRMAEWLDQPQLPIILAIARPVRKKNLIALVRAYLADEKLRAAANLVVLAGQHGLASGEERVVIDELTALCATPEARGHVMLPADHDSADVAALYERASEGGVFVNPALHEPFGLTLVEAAAAGVPVVATRNGGPQEIVATIGHGITVDPRDEGALATAIRAIVLDPARHARLAGAARRGHRQYSWDRYAALSVETYRECNRPRLLISDIDNTLTGCRSSAFAFAGWRTRSTLPFIVATGRSLAAAQTILRQWGLPMPDAFIVDVGTRLMIADGKGGWRECDDYARLLDNGWDRNAVHRALATLPLSPQPAETEGPHKISFFGNERDANAIRQALAAAGQSARVVFSHGRLIDVLAPNGGKAAAIAAYAQSQGLSLAQCVAAGDSGNDVDMLTACGRAIVVGNAGSELDDLPERPGLLRVHDHHAAGVLEGLASLGITVPSLLPEAA